MAITGQLTNATASQAPNPKPPSANWKEILSVVFSSHQLTQRTSRVQQELFSSFPAAAGMLHAPASFSGGLGELLMLDGQHRPIRWAATVTTQRDRLGKETATE